MRRDDFPVPVAPGTDRPTDRYRCGRVCRGEGLDSQSCLLGPTANGVCRHEKEPCSPVATTGLVARRIRSGIAVLALMFLAGGSYWFGIGFYKPGPLSAPHAQILSGQLTKDSCAACHPQAQSSPLSWFLTGHQGENLTQTDRCMDCHHTRLPRQFAGTAHNLSPTELADATARAARIRLVANQAATVTVSATQDVACASCHREHGGAHVSLTALSDAQCQSCHQQQFASFASNHPAWEQWPYQQDESIRFDHKTHSMRHFPASKDDLGNPAKFDCLSCHAKTETGEFSRVTSYEVACQQCHDKALQQQTSERLDLFVLPTLLHEPTADEAGWPKSATGFYDGKVGPLALHLLRTDPVISQALAQLPSDGDFGRIQPQDAVQQQAAELVALAIRNRLMEMASQGPIPTLNQSQLAGPWHQILRGLSPQLLVVASHQWFGKRRPGGLKAETQTPQPLMKFAGARSNADDLLLDTDDGVEMADPLLDQTLSPPEESELVPDTDRTQDSTDFLRPAPQRIELTLDPAVVQPEGGWYIDDTRMAISYRGFGHSDPVLRAAIELAAGLPVDDPVRKQLLGTSTAMACVECHAGVTHESGLNWRASGDRNSLRPTFTKFSHQPHMNIATLADCSTCHAIQTSSDNLDVRSIRLSGESSELHLNGPTNFTTHDFLPLPKQVCASCHRPQAASDACITCHQYHRESLNLTGLDSKPASTERVNP